MSYMGGELAKKNYEARGWRASEKNQKACTTSAMSNGGGERAKKKKKTQGPTGVGRTSAVAKLVAYATATTTTTTTPPHHHHIATSSGNTQHDMSNQMSPTKVVDVFCPCGAAGDHRRAAENHYRLLRRAT
jgi:hypothetical protein